MIRAKLVPKEQYPAYIKLDDDEDTGPTVIIWTKQEALEIAHKLMSLAHELQREIEK